MGKHDLESIAGDLRDEVDALEFGPPVATVYNPLRYAWRPHREYLRRYGRHLGGVFLLGMNPGPWGMAQTGVPFGEVAAVRDWLRIRSTAVRPAHEHPKRPVQGFACSRSEVSGRRLWGWAADRFVTPDVFFERFFVGNYCPLQFLADGGRNLTPDTLARGQRSALFDVCDRALRRTIAVLEPRLVVGIGVFAERRARAVLGGESPPVGRILHPSPASPAANRGWAEAATRELRELGVAVP